MADKTGGARVILGTDIPRFQLAILKGRLKLEMKGMKPSKGQTAYAILRGMGFTGPRVAVLDQVCLLVKLHQTDGLELEKPEWWIAEKLKKMGLVTISEPRGPDNAWVRVKLTEKGKI